MDYKKIAQTVQEYMINGRTDDDAFTEIAQKLFAFQYKNNQAYRKYCRKRRVTPASIEHFTDIPPVHINAFKETELACSPINDAQAVFMTSGTTNPDKKGKNIHRDLETWNLSMQTYFKECMMPDVDEIQMVILFPEKEEMPNSSLAHYLHLAKEKFGTKESEYVVSTKGLDINRLKELLIETEQNQKPIFLLGATFSFIHFLDHCDEQNLSFSLPVGSRIMDTGGAKGRSREMDPIELKLKLCEIFNVPEHLYGNMYGMTELSSQLYTQELRQYALDEEMKPTIQAPHWMRTVIIDPETMKEKPEGEKGIIVHYDLANLNSVMAIMTEDVGIKEGKGFYLLGRAQGAEAKGCSLAVEQFLASNRKD